MQQFKIFRALGMSFKAWFANFVPFTVLAAVLFSPVIIWAVMLPGGEAGYSPQRYVDFFERGTWVLVGLSALLAPMLIYRVIEHLNGRRASILTSIKFGARGISCQPAICALPGVTNASARCSLSADGWDLLRAIVTMVWSGSSRRRSRSSSASGRSPRSRAAPR